MHNLEELSAIVMGRTPNMFIADIRNNLEHIRKYKSALFVGGAGTIGLATIKQFMEWGCLERIGILDQDENRMAEAIRSVRNRSLTVTLDAVVGDAMDGFDIRGYDIVLWFAAMKHVRSERDLASCRRMLAINSCGVSGLHADRFFYCSTDKAADPASMLGASKRLGEAVAISWGTAARFANVAFSSGSLLESWLYRIAEGHPLPVPMGVRRYLMSPAEAGRICMLAATWKDPKTVLFPLMVEDTLLVDAAKRFAEHFGYDRIAYTKLDTDGEKDAEVFHGKDEEILAAGLQINRVIPQDNIGDIDFDECETKEELVAAVSRAIPKFRHAHTGNSLDAKV